MTDSFTALIAQLERQKAAIERALTALQDVDTPATAAHSGPAAAPQAPRHRRRFSPAARRKMALAQKARWAKIKGEIEPPVPKPSKPKRRISAEGIKRIIAATKKRWRLQRAAAKAASAKKVAPKKVAAKKTVVKAPPAKTAKKVAPVRKTTVKHSAPALTPDIVHTAGSQ
jgi:hypothetical protein